MGWILAILAGGLVTFNAVVTPDRAASEAAKALQKKFPGAEVSVKIEGKRGNDVLNGRFQSVDIELANLTLDELPIETAALPLANATASATATPSASASATASARPAQGAGSAASALAGGTLPASKAKVDKAKKPKLGRAGNLNIVVRKFRWQELPVERADFRFENVEYDFGAMKNDSQFKLVRTSHATMHLELAPDALTPFVAKRVANVSDAAVKMKDGRILVTGQRNFYGIGAPFELQGRPGFVGSDVVLQAPKLLLSGVAVPALVASPLLESVNPLYSFTNIKGLPFEVKLTKVEARDGKLQIDGDLTLKTLER